MSITPMHIGPSESDYTIPQRSCAATVIKALDEYGKMEDKELFKTIYGNGKKENNNGHKEDRTFFWTMRMLREDGIISVEHEGRAPKRMRRYSLTSRAKAQVRGVRTKTRLEYARRFDI